MNREHLLKEEVARTFFQQVLERAQLRLSDEHFTVDGTLIEAWAGHRASNRRKRAGGGNDSQRAENFHGQVRSDETHRSTTDPQSRLYSEIERHRGEAVLLGARADGEPEAGEQSRVSPCR